MKRIVFIVVGVLVAIPSLNRATIVHVPQDQPTIQVGIDAAVDGDTVLVDTGRYVETINFNGKNIVVGSLFLTTGDTSYISRTVIDGDSSGNVVTFESGEDSTAVLAGFTLIDGLGWGVYCMHSSPSVSNLTISGNLGGGLYSKGADLRLRSVVIRNNWSAGEGGGIVSDSSSLRMEDVEISGNLSTTSGGGIYAQGSSLFLKDTRVLDNEAWEGSGGGIYLDDSDLRFHGGSVFGNNAFFSGGGIVLSGSGAVFDSVSVTENRCDYGGGGLLASNSDVVFKNGWVADNVADFSSGGGFLCTDTELTVERSAIVFNDAAEDGGGIKVSTSAEISESPGWPPTLLLNVTMVGNTASRGGGLFCSNLISPVVVNSILWNNTPQEIGFDDSAWWPSDVTITHSNVLGGKDSILATERDSVYWLKGNIDVDPLFFDPHQGDFHLQQQSPAIDAGTAFFGWEGDTLVNLPDTTYEGNAPDMGALESPYSTTVLAGNSIPVEFALYQNYPNPFNPTTTIEFSVPQSGLVTLTVYDLLGREIATLIDGHVEAGPHSMRWDASGVSSGIYIVAMKAGRSRESLAGAFVEARKVILLR